MWSLGCIVCFMGCCSCGGRSLFVLWGMAIALFGCFVSFLVRGVLRLLFLGCGALIFSLKEGSLEGALSCVSFISVISTCSLLFCLSL